MLQIENNHNQVFSSLKYAFNKLREFTVTIMSNLSHVDERSQLKSDINTRFLQLINIVHYVMRLDMFKNPNQIVKNVEIVRINIMIEFRTLAPPFRCEFSIINCYFVYLKK